eukprot:SAG31_NODE_8721_length_1399_cov_7.550000_3_plen_76_part_00
MIPSVGTNPQGDVPEDERVGAGGHTDGRDHVDDSGDKVAGAAPSSAALAELMGLGFSEQQATEVISYFLVFVPTM